MCRELRVLFNEDSSRDVELLVALLANEFEISRKMVVESKETYLNALQNDTFDLIISDFTLPQFDGLEALKLRNEHAPSVPFILVTGTINDEKAVEFMKLGADDYLLKQYLTKIAESVKAILKNREIRLQKEKAEEDLRKSELRLRSYFNITGAGLAITSPTTGWIDVNDQLCLMLGYTREEIFTTTWPELTYPDDLDADLEHFDKVINNCEDGYTIDKRFVRKNGEAFWTTLSVRCVREANGSLDYCVAIIIDINDKKRVQNELIQAKEKAEENDRLKTAFLNNVSHEVRTPLNAIVGFATLLAEKDTDEESRLLYVDTIISSSEHLISIMNDIIEISNIEAGIVKLAVSVVNLKESLGALYNQFLQKAKEKALIFSLILPENQEDMLIRTDPKKLSRILSSLLENAFKFTCSGEIKFGFTRNRDLIRFFVSDTGIGISRNDEGRIFEKFYQVQHDLDRQYEGTGLGLPISKALAEKLGCSIQVQSEPGKGSVFSFEIPVNYEESNNVKTVSRNTETKSKTGYKIIVAEDNQNNFRVIELFLQRPDLSILHAWNGQEAVDLFTVNRDTDLILMDIKMPVMDGYAASELIRSMDPLVPIVAQTAFVDDADKAYKSGCIEILTKPFRKEEILSVAARYLEY